MLIFALDKTLNPKDFTIIRREMAVADVPDGAVRLRSEMARCVAKVAYEAIEPSFAPHPKAKVAKAADKLGTPTPSLQMLQECENIVSPINMIGYLSYPYRV